MWWLNITYPQYSGALLKNVQASVLASACDVYLCKCFFSSQEQYIYVYQALVELSEVAVIPCSELRQTFEGLCRNNKLAEQFEVYCVYIVILQVVPFI